MDTTIINWKCLLCSIQHRLQNHSTVQQEWDCTYHLMRVRRDNWQDNGRGFVAWQISSLVKYAVSTVAPYKQSMHDRKQKWKASTHSKAISIPRISIAAPWWVQIIQNISTPTLVLSVIPVLSQVYLPVWKFPLHDIPYYEAGLSIFGGVSWR